MSEFTVTHTCGHEVKHRYDGPENQRARREKWLREKPCQTCWRDQQNKQATEESESLGLPPLQGTDEDIAWAEVIRAKAMTGNLDFHKRVNRPPTNDPEKDKTIDAVQRATDHAIEHLKTQDEAEWWIEHRFDVVSHVRNAAIRAVESLNDSA